MSRNENTKLTPWFPVSTKPTRKGLYDVRDRSVPCDCCHTWAHWDGKQWVRYGNMAGILGIYELARDVRVWRGLAEKPE